METREEREAAVRTWVLELLAPLGEHVHQLVVETHGPEARVEIGRWRFGEFRVRVYESTPEERYEVRVVGKVLPEGHEFDETNAATRLVLSSGCGVEERRAIGPYLQGKLRDSLVRAAALAAASSRAVDRRSEPPEVFV